MMAMADRAGHTQKEVATVTFDEIQDDGKDVYVDRDRNKPASTAGGRFRLKLLR